MFYQGEYLDELLHSGLIQEEDFHRRRTLAESDPLAAFDPRFGADFSTNYAQLSPAQPTPEPAGAPIDSFIGPQVIFAQPLQSTLSTQPITAPQAMKRSYMDSGLTSSSDKVSKVAKTSAAAPDATSAGPDLNGLAKFVDREPSSFASEAEVQEWFGQIAHKLLNESVLHINDVPHRFIEIEFYYKGGVHNDFFTHCDEMQKANGCWYFHKQGKAFRSGTYKGLDFTIGKPGAYGGVLIRAVENLTEGTLVEGPSLVVDHILNLNDVGSIDEFVRGFDVSAFAKSKLYISALEPGAAHSYKAEQVFTSPRVGLTLKRNDNNQAKFIMRLYRFFLRPNKLKKGKVNIVLAMIAQGKSVDQIFKLSGSPKKSIEKYMELYENAKAEKTPKAFYSQALSTDDLCELFGACEAAEQN